MALPWTESPTIEIDLDLPPKKRLAVMPDDLLVSGAALVAAMRRDSPPIPPGLAQVLDAGTSVDFRAEAEAWAGLLGVSWQEAIGANCAYDLVVNFLACSGVLVESDRGPVLARNMDWWPEAELAKASCLLRFTRARGPRFWIAGWPASIGAVSGMSARGFAIALHAVLCDERPLATGFPVMLWIREVLEHARGFDDAVDRLATEPLASPCLLGVVGTRNEERAVIERTPRRSEVRRGVPGVPLVVTNDYRLLDERPRAEAITPLTASSCGRFDALTRFFEDVPRAAIRDEVMLYALGEPGVKMEITAQQMVFRPSDEHARLVVPTKLLGRFA